MDYKDVIDRAGKLQEFEVLAEVPQGFRFNGKIPYDMDILGNQAFVKIFAENIEEATQRVKEFFNND